MTDHASLRGDLLGLVRGYRPRGATDRWHRQRAEQLLQSVADPTARRHFHPGHFTASAFVLSPDHEAVLLILHGKLGRWCQPGGHFESEDDSLLAAARRECIEEVGIDGLTPVTGELFDLDIHPIAATPAEPAHEHFDLRVLCRAPSWAFRVGSDARDARWVSIEDALRWADDASVARALRKLG